MAENFTNMNHGAYGSTPRRVLQAQWNYMLRMENDINQWMRLPEGYKGEIVKARRKVAKYINAPEEDVVLIDNASNGINLLLRDWLWKATSVILDLSTGYGPFKAYYQWLGATKEVETVTVKVKFPVSSNDDIVLPFQKTLARVKSEGKHPVVIVSQVSSSPAIVLPVGKIVALCKAADVPVIVDGAHALGAVPVDIHAMQPDFWFGNGHKWLYAPHTVAALYVSKKYQTAYTPEPTVVDSFGDNFTTRFAWDGTRDRTAFAAMQDAFAFREWIGGEAAILNYTYSLSRKGADYLVQAWGTGMLAPHSMQATMHNVRVPTNSTAACTYVGQGLYEQYGIFVFAISMDDIPCYLRVHSQIYLDMSDYHRLAKATMDLLRDFHGQNEAALV